MKTITIVMLLLFSGMVSCKRYSREKSNLEPILGVVDLPAKGATVHGAAPIGGWAVADSGVQRVVLYVDKQFIAFAALGGDRPDIAKAFPVFSDAAKSGWSTVIDFSQMIEGDHELVMQVKTKAGNVHDFPPVPFKVAH
jgi:hypothetical protein